MDNLVWYITMIPCSALLTGVGIYAWNRKKPMWFWSGAEVKEPEVSDVTAYNHANGIMWCVYSLIFWIATFIGVFNEKATLISLILIIIGCAIGLPLLVLVYKRIYAKYKA